MTQTQHGNDVHRKLARFGMIDTIAAFTKVRQLPFERMHGRHIFNARADASGTRGPYNGGNTICQQRSGTASVRAYCRRPRRVGTDAHIL